MTIGRWLSRRDRAASVGSVFSLATAVAVVLLATALLSATVFDPFPYRSAHELAVLSGTAAPSQGIQGLFGRFVARESTVFQAVEFFQMPETLRIGVERPLSVNAIRVSPGLTSALGVQFLAGRPPSSDREVALSEGLRQRLFGGAPLKSLGATVVISGVVHEIVGILPPKFFFPDNTVEVYLALNGDATFSLGFVHALVRLKPPVAEALAREQLAALVRHYNRESGARAGAVLHPLPDLILGSQRQALWALVMWCVAMVLLATANVANLQITRVRARLPDLALRIAFGATPRSEIVGLVIYLTFLAASGVVLGAGCASLGLAYLKAQQLREVIGLDAAAISLPASAVIGVTVWGALCAWALPSMRRLHSAGVANLLRTGGAGQGRVPSLRHGTWLLPVQLAVSIGLVILTTCLLLTFRQLTNADWGFSPSGVSIVEFDLPVTMARHVAEQTETVEAILSRVRQEPAVISAGVGYTAPFRAGSWKVVFLAADGASKTYAPLFKISPGYFRSLGTKMLAGRDFAQAPSSDGELPIIVGQHVAQVLWPNESAIGRRLRIMKPSAGVNAPRMTLETQPDDPVFAAPGALVTAENRERVVVGVVEDMRMGSLNLERRWAVYIDYRQQYIDQWYGAVGHRLVIRSLSEPATLARSVGKIIASMAAGATLGATHDLGALVDQSIGGTGSSKLVLLCLGGMDVVAFVLAAFGVYVLTRAVLAARQREYAIRLSLGCTLGVIRRHVATALTRGFATGLVLAGLGVYAGTQLLSQQLPLVFHQLWVAIIVAGPLVVAALLCPMFIVLRRIRLLNPWELLRD